MCLWLCQFVSRSINLSLPPLLSNTVRCRETDDLGHLTPYATPIFGRDFRSSRYPAHKSSRTNVLGWCCFTSKNKGNIRDLSVYYTVNLLRYASSTFFLCLLSSNLFQQSILIPDLVSVFFLALA